jgi:hypothetical protein
MILLPLMLAAATPAANPNDADLRCLAVFATAVNGASADQRPGIIADLMYFFGKIDARSPGYDFNANLKRLLPSMTNDGMKADIQRCGAIVEARGAYLQKMGDALKGG